MNVRKRNYIIFAVIIGVFIILVRFAKIAGFSIQSDFMNAVLTIVFYSPIVAFLFYLSNDVRLGKVWKIILRILAIQMIVANLLGIILSWLA